MIINNPAVTAILAVVAAHLWYTCHKKRLSEWLLALGAFSCGFFATRTILLILLKLA